MEYKTAIPNKFFRFDKISNSVLEVEVI